MNAPINAAVDFLVAHGPTILVGGTLLLAAGALATMAQRSPATRQRAAEMTILGLVVWLVLACVPLPRHEFSRWFSSRALDIPARNEFAAKDGAAVEGAPASGSVQDLETVEVPAELLIELSSEQRLGQTRVAPDRVVSNRAAPRAPEVGRLAVVDRVDWRRVGALVYLVGAIGSLAWLLFGQGLLWHVLRIAEPPEPWLARLFDQAADSMASCRVRPTIRLLVSRRCRRPFSCGLWRPTIVLPASHCRREQAERLRSVLLHELGHVVRGDAWGHQLFHLGLPLAFFHPLYWYLRWAAQLSRELIADDCAARRSSPEAYVRQLIALVRETGSGLAPAAVPAIFTSRTQFYRRMTMLIRRESPLATNCTFAWRSAALAALALAVSAATWTLGVEPIAAQAPPDKLPATTPRRSTAPETVPGQDKRDQSTPRAETPRTAGLGVVVDVSDTPAPAEKTTQPAPDLVTVEIGSDTTAADGAGQTELEAELVKLEKQVQDLRARLAKAQGAATAARRPKTPEATVEVVPATGKLWSRRRLMETAAPKDELPRLPAEGHAAGTIVTPAAGGETIAATPAAAHQPAAEAAVGGLHLDLVRLAEAYADAVGGVEISRARLEQAQAAAQEANAGAAARAEVRVQEITVRTAQRKLTSLRRIAEVVTGTAEQEANSAEEEIKHVKQLYERGYVSESHVRDAMRRYQSVQVNLKTLRSILSE